MLQHMQFLKGVVLFLSKKKKRQRETSYADDLFKHNTLIFVLFTIHIQSNYQYPSETATS